MISSLELARLCHVSQGTVDRALHNRPGISAATRERILAVAKEHDYLPHPAMQELLSGRSNLVGGIVPSFENPFFMDLMHAAKQACVRSRLRLFITPVADRDEFLEVLSEFASRRFAGVLAVPPEEDIYLRCSLTASCPVATFLSSCRGSGTRLFAPDETATGETAVDYLAARGHRRILHVTYSRKARGIAERTQGYRNAMKRLRLKPQVHIWSGEVGFEQALKQEPPSAIFCHNDWLALAVIRLLNRLGIDVPEDVSVLGVDNSPTFKALYPGIATLHYPMEETAGQAVSWISGASEQLPFAPLPPLQIVADNTVRSIV